MQYWLIYIILFIIGALIFYILKGVCGCKTVEGQAPSPPPPACSTYNTESSCTDNNCFWTGFPTGLDKIDNGIYKNFTNKCLSVYKGSMGETIKSRIDDNQLDFKNRCGDQNTSKCCWNGLIDDGQWIDKKSVCCQSTPMLDTHSAVWPIHGLYECKSETPCPKTSATNLIDDLNLFNPDNNSLKTKCEELNKEDIYNLDNCSKYYQKNSGGGYTACEKSLFNSYTCTSDIFSCTMRNFGLPCCSPDESISED